MRFKRVSCQYEAYAEAELVNQGDVVACVDDTRLTPIFLGDPDEMVLSGEILDWNGLTITGSQPCVLNADHEFLFICSSRIK